MVRRRSLGVVLLGAWLTLALAPGCTGDAPAEHEQAPATAPSPAASPAAAGPHDTSPTPPFGIARHCTPAPVEARLAGPSEAEPRDLDLQFHFRAAAVCQDLHELEIAARSRFRPLENLTVLSGVGHRVLLLLPSLEGRTSVARYRVALADAPAAELVAWVTLEKSAAAQSDGVELAVGVGDADTDPAAVPLDFSRLTRDEAQAGWREVRVDLSPWRRREVWIVLAAREPGERSGDWLLWGDPRIIARDPPPARVDLGALDASTRRSAETVHWGEVNVFKAYSGFNEEQAARLDPRWLERSFPWVDTLRLFASLGASWGPTLARDYESQMGHNPSRDSRDERRWAEYYEFFRDGPGWEGVPVRERFDWTRFDALLARIASTGARLHVNLAGAPELFTGGRGHYHTYHFNEMPVVDEAGWKTYVDQVFRHLSQQPWFARARFSFFSEPNAVWLADDGSVRHFGYQGDAAQYARQYLWTWQAMKPWVRGEQVHLGPFVVEPDPTQPAVDNLDAYLREIRAAFSEAGVPLPPWSAFAVNVYESPQVSIEHFASYKLDAVRALLRTELPELELPLRLDEVGIHPLLVAAFEEAGVPHLEGSRWAAAWHAEMLALLVEQDVAVGSAWLHSEMMRPYAAHAFASLATGAFEPRRTEDGRLALERRPGTSPPASRPVLVRLAGESADRVGYLAWPPPGDDLPRRVLLWRLPRFPLSDEAIRAAGPAAPVRIGLPDCGAAPCTVAVLGYDDQAFAGLTGERRGEPQRERFAAGFELPPVRRDERLVRGELALDLLPGDVYLVEVRRTSPAR